MSERYEGLFDPIISKSITAIEDSNIRETAKSYKLNLVSEIQSRVDLFDTKMLIPIFMGGSLPVAEAIWEGVKQNLQVNTTDKIKINPIYERGYYQVRPKTQIPRDFFTVRYPKVGPAESNRADHYYIFPEELLIEDIPPRSQFIFMEDIVGSGRKISHLAWMLENSISTINCNYINEPTGIQTPNGDNFTLNMNPALIAAFNSEPKFNIDQELLPTENQSEEMIINESTPPLFKEIYKRSIIIGDRNSQGEHQNNTSAELELRKLVRFLTFYFSEKNQHDNTIESGTQRRTLIQQFGMPITLSPEESKPFFDNNSRMYSEMMIVLSKFEDLLKI